MARRPRDVMTDSDAPALTLPHSFHVGPLLAEQANRWLQLAQAPIRLTGSETIPTEVGDVANPAAVLCRTNEAPSRSQGVGRRRRCDREVPAAIVSVATSGCTWQRLPTASFSPSGATAHRRFSEWIKARVWVKLHRLVLDELGARGELDCSRCAIDSVNMRALLGLIPSDVVAVAVAAEGERVLLSFSVLRHTPEIDEDIVDVIGDLEAFLYPDNPLIESRVVVGEWAKS